MHNVRLGRAALARLVATSTFALLASSAVASAQDRLPDRLTDQEYWALISQFSENPGYFRSENLVSNETAFQYVLDGLTRVARPGQVYLGVAPEQNFTYIAAIKPKMAIILDIRNGNKLQHLLYKSLFEMSADRAEFISRLFSKPRPRGLDTTVTIDSIFNAFWYVNTDSVLYRQNKEAVKNHLTKVHSFPLSEAEWADLVFVYDQFYIWGPGFLTYNSGTSNSGGMPSYAEVMMSTDQRGVNRGYLATEANWRWIKDLESRNMLVPVVGDFAGPKALRSIGAWLKERNATVAAIYASNVEQYLWQDGKAYTYYDNVAQLPIDANTVWIRSNGAARSGGGSGMRAPNVVCSVQRLLAENKAQNVWSYATIFNYCY